MDRNYEKRGVQPQGKGMRRASHLLRVRFQAPSGLALVPSGKGETAWLGSETEVRGSAPASGAGRRGNDEPKGGGNGARPVPELSAKKEGGARPSRGSGRTASPAPDQGDGGGGPAERRGGDWPAPSPRRSRGPVAPARVFPKPPADARLTETDRHGSRRPGGRGPRRGSFPAPGPERGECKSGLRCEAERPEGNHRGGRVCVPERRDIRGTQARHSPAWSLRTVA